MNEELIPEVNTESTPVPEEFEEKPVEQEPGAPAEEAGAVLQVGDHQPRRGR